MAVQAIDRAVRRPLRNLILGDLEVNGPTLGLQHPTRGTLLSAVLIDPSGESRWSVRRIGLRVRFDAMLDRRVNALLRFTLVQLVLPGGSDCRPTRPRKVVSKRHAVGEFAFAP